MHWLCGTEQNGFLWWPGAKVCIVLNTLHNKILSLATSNTLNHYSYSRQWNSTETALNACNFVERYWQKKKPIIALLWTRDMHSWRAGILSIQEQYSNSEPEVASIFCQLETDNCSIMSLQRPNNKQLHAPQVNKTSFLSHTWQTERLLDTIFQLQSLSSLYTKYRKYTQHLESTVW